MDEGESDPSIVLAAVTRYGGALEYAHESLKSDHAIVLAAVTQHGGALEYAHESLKSDHAIVLAAVTQHGWALEDAHESLKSDPAFVQAAVYNQPDALQYASKSLQHDTKCLALFIHAVGLNLMRRPASPELRLRVAKAVAHIAAWLKDWRALEMVLVAMKSVGVHEEGEGCEKRRKLGVGRCVLGMLDTGYAVVARGVGPYLGTPGCFVGVSGLRVVDVYEDVVDVYEHTVAMQCDCSDGGSDEGSYEESDVESSGGESSDGEVDY
jgi:hypothetical protein